MKEIIATGKSLESIREEWAEQWSCSPEQLLLEIIDKAGVFNRTMKVKVTLPEEEEEIQYSEDTNITWDGTKYTIIPGVETESIIPITIAGKLFNRGIEIKNEFSIQRGDIFEFFPESKKGGLSWKIHVEADGSKALAKVRHEHSGRYVLAEEIPRLTRIPLDRYITWEPMPDIGEVLTEENLEKELAEKGIIYGIKPNIWVEFLMVEGEKELVIAESTLPIQPIQSELIDYVGKPVFDSDNEDYDEEKIDYFACKLRICHKNEVLAKKIPGKEGTSGINIFGQTIPVDQFKDFEFKLNKNVYLSEDGLEVKALSSGTPLRMNNYTYSVENAYIINKDIDLETGSINFPGDVCIGGDIKDGLYVYSEGKVQVQGSVSSAEVKGETGLVVKNNIIASRIKVGEKHVFRSQFVKRLLDINEGLAMCIHQVEQLQNVSGNTNAGQLLKILLEKNFSQLPLKAEELEALLINKDPDFISQELEVAVKTLKHFLVGIGPLQLKNLVYLKSALKAIGYFLSTKGELIPASVVCDMNYVQNSEIRCAGDFICKKGIYNSNIHIEGDIKILGVCRGGEINCSGDIYIWELGGSCMSATTIRAAKNSRINVDYSHPNVKIYVGKELVKIEEGVQKLEIYREKGILQVEKLKWDGRN